MVRTFVGLGVLLAFLGVSPALAAAVSSGCIRMTNQDVMDLYDRVRVTTTVAATR